MKPLATRHQPPATSGSQLHAPCSPLRKRSAFTLIELLVVIAIIAILAGLGFAGLQGAMESSRKAQARNDVHQIASAVKAYLLEYGRLPDQASTIAELTGSNPKRIVFLEAKNAKGNPPKGGLTGGGSSMLDPWGTTYSVNLDDDYDNRITADVGAGSQAYLTSVIVQSAGPDQNLNSTADNLSNVK
jgi:prepilin-type N-terminal cleavage/methylation domain-containing protein